MVSFFLLHFPTTGSGPCLAPSKMADKNEHHIPTWDGQAKTWRRYSMVCSWHCSGEDEILRHLADLPPDRPSTPLGYELEDHRVRHARWNTAFVAEARTGQSPDILKATRGFLEFDAITKVTEALQTLCDEQLAGRCQTHSVAYQETFFSEDDYLPCGESQPSWTSTLQLWQHEALCSRLP